MPSPLEYLGPVGDMAQRGMNNLQNLGNTDFAQLIPLILQLIQGQGSQPNPLSGVQSGAQAAPAPLKQKITKAREEY